MVKIERKFLEIHRRRVKNSLRERGIQLSDGGKGEKSRTFRRLLFFEGFYILNMEYGCGDQIFFLFSIFFFTVAIFQLEPQIELSLDGHQLIVEETGLRI